MLPRSAHTSRCEDKRRMLRFSLLKKRNILFIAPLYGIIDVYTRTPKRRGGLDPPVVILINARNRPHLPRGARAAPGRGWRHRRSVPSKAGSKQGVCPAPRSSYTISAHHPGPYHPTSGSPHPDTRGWAQTTTPRPQPPHSEDINEATSVVSSRLHILSTHLARHHPARQPSGSAQGLGGTPGGVVETAEQRHFCKRSSRRREEW